MWGEGGSPPVTVKPKGGLSIRPRMLAVLFQGQLDVGRGGCLPVTVMPKGGLSF